MSAAPPVRLEGARLVDLAVQGPPGALSLALWLENVRRHGLVCAGTLALDGVHRVTSREPRLLDDEFALEPGFTIYGARWSPHRLELDCVRPTGPGEGDRPTYAIDFADCHLALRPRLGGSLRALAGFYPLASDLSGERFGPGPRRFPIATLNARP